MFALAPAPLDPCAGRRLSRTPTADSEITVSPQVKWNAGKTEKFGGEWKAGDVIGLAVSVPADGGGAGGIWVSYNGSFDEPYGQMIAAADLASAAADGTFPALTASPGIPRVGVGNSPTLIRKEGG